MTFFVVLLKLTTLPLSKAWSAQTGAIKRPLDDRLLQGNDRNPSNSISQNLQCQCAFKLLQFLYLCHVKLLALFQ